MSEYELFRSKWRVTEWLDGAIYRTQLLESDWYDMDDVDHANTVETNILYTPPVAAVTDAQRRGIRRKQNK